MKFLDTDQKYAVEDQLNWILLKTYQIELHLNALIYLSNLMPEKHIHHYLSSSLIDTHYRLVLIDSTILLKQNNKSDEKKPLKQMRCFFNEEKIDVTKPEVSQFLSDIDKFYKKSRHLMEKLPKTRNAMAAHEFNTLEQTKQHNENSIAFPVHLRLILEVRDVVARSYESLLDRKFENFEIDINLYQEIYKASSNLLLIDNANKI